MRVVRPTDPKAFRDMVRPILEVSEARHNLFYGILGTLIEQPEVYDRYALWMVERGGAPVAAALRTPPHHAVLADAGDATAAAALAEAMATDDPDVPGVSGNVPTVGWFVDAFCRITARAARRQMAQGVFALTEVDPPPTPAGKARRASHRDIELLTIWHEAFAAAAVPEEPFDTDRVRAVVERRIDRMRGSGVWLWEFEGRPVSLSGHDAPTPHGMRIGPVYTPPEHRRRGFASALVAHQSAELLAEGRTFCFLFTDLANPTSNAIYQRIGYRQVAEAAMWAFERNDGEESLDSAAQGTAGREGEPIRGVTPPGGASQ